MNLNDLTYQPTDNTNDLLKDDLMKFSNLGRICNNKLLCIGKAIKDLLQSYVRIEGKMIICLYKKRLMIWQE